LDYQETVEFVIDRAFGINIAHAVRSELEVIQESKKTTDDISQNNIEVLITDYPDKRDKVLITVSQIKPSSFDEVKDYFKKQGETIRLKQEDFTNIIARNTGTKKYYFHNKELGRWELSGLGDFRFKQLVKEENNE